MVKTGRSPSSLERKMTGLANGARGLCVRSSWGLDTDIINPPLVLDGKVRGGVYV